MRVVDEPDAQRAIRHSVDRGLNRRENPVRVVAERAPADGRQKHLRIAGSGEIQRGDLERIAGIGGKTLESLRPFVTVEGETRKR